MEENIGILFNRKLIDYGIYLFKPEILIEGRLEQENDLITYYDKNGYEYLTISDAQTLNSDDETVVGYVISEKDLLKKYKGLTVNEAKVKYYDDITNLVHIGFYLIEQDLIAISAFNFRAIYERINSMEIDINNSITDTDSQKTVPNSSTEEIANSFITIEHQEFERIINLKNLKEMKEELEALYKRATELEETEDYTLIKEEVTGQYITDLFEASYERLLSINNIAEIEDVIKEIEKNFIELACVIDEKAKGDNNVKGAKEFLYKLVDSYDELLKIDSLSKIKEEFEKIKKAEEPRIKELAEKYDKSFSYEITQQESIGTAKDEEIINVKETKSFFDEKIIGQEEAKKDVISAIFMNKLSDNPSNKNSCLLVGPTGSGKTLLAQTVSEYFDMPIEIIDTTQLTIPGYIGANIEDFLVRLLEKAKGNLEKAEEGIVVFDELDKKGSEKKEDASGRGVLNVLLPFLQGTTYDIKYNGKIVRFNTSKLTIFATGAFTDVAKGKENGSVLNAYKNTNIGYNSDLKKSKDEDIKYEKLEIEDFVKYGNMPIEIMGRFSTIAQLTGHTKETLKLILTNSNISALLSEKNKLKKIGIDLNWTEGYIDAVATKAMELKTGGRSLKTTVEKSIKEARWSVIEDLDKYKAIILTEKTVEDNRNCELVYVNGNSINLSDILCIEVPKQKQKNK